MSRPPPDPLYILRGVGSSVTAVGFRTFCGNGQQLLSGDQKGIVSIWNLSTKRTECTLNGHDNKSILNVRHIQDDIILSHGRDGYIHTWNVEKNKIQDSLKVQNVGFCKCEILDGFQKNVGICLAVASEEQTQIDIVCLKTKQCFKKLKPELSEKLGMVMCLKSTGRESPSMLLAGYESGDIILWDVDSSNMISKLCVHKEPVMCIDFDFNSNRGVTGSAEDKVTVFKLTHKSLVVEKFVQLKNSGISDVKIRGDCKILATAGWDNKLRIFSWKSLKPLAILNYHSQSVDTLAFSNCKEQLLAAGSKDGRISLWSLYKEN